jgi:predicted small integral membrane protein
MAQTASNRRWWLSPVWAVQLVVLALGLGTFGDYGVTTDETLRMRAADPWAAAIATGDVHELAHGVRSHYGVAFDQLGRLLWLAHRDWLGGTDEFAARHLLCFLTYWLGLWATYGLARRLAPAPVPVLAVVLLVLAPRLWGSAFANPKDIPFMTAWVWAMLACTRAIQQPGRRSTLLLALAIGVCAAVRPFGVVFFGLGAASILASIAPGGLRGRRRVWVRALQEIVLLWVVAYAVVAALWPVLWVSPPWRLVEATLALTRHVEGSMSLFMGRVYPFWDAPGGYVAVWLAITVPLPTVVLALYGLPARAVALWRERNGEGEGAGVRAWALWMLVTLWVLGPLVVPMLRSTTLYDTVRQVLFVVPALAILAADGAVRLGRFARGLRGSRAARIWLPFVGLLGLAYGEVAARMIRLHPYESLYFSPLVGGLRGAAGRFDVAHYSETYREGFSWLAAHAERPVFLHVTGNGNTTAAYYGYKHGMQLNRPRFGWFMSEVRQGWETLLPGPVVHTVEREGVPLLVIRKVDPIDAMEGAWLRRLPHAVQGPLHPRAGLSVSEGWRPVAAVDGVIDTSAQWAEPGPTLMAVRIDSPRAQQLRLWLRYYWGMRAWLDGELLYEGDVVPFQYRATHDFPSLVPLSAHVGAGTHWLVLDLTRIHWPRGIGVYFPAAQELRTPAP